MDFRKAIDLINKSSNVLITTHTRPDGDACGCMVALQQILTEHGKKANLLLLSPIPKWYEFLFDRKVPVLGSDITLDDLKAGSFAACDLVIIVDTNSYNQLPNFEKYLKNNKKSVLIIDHHVTSDGLGDVELVDPSAAATGQIVFDLYKYADWPMNKKVAEALFVAMATDTGWFQFSNTDSRVYRASAELIDIGLVPTKVYHDLYQNFSHERFKLMAAMFSTLELHFDGRLATQYISQRHFEQTGAAFEDTENLIDECRRMATVEVAALFVELKDGKVKCSLRSTGDVDVRKIAQKFDGGGHKTAAGLTLSGSLEKAKKLIYDAISEQFAKINRS